MAIHEFSSIRSTGAVGLHPTFKATYDLAGTLLSLQPGLPRLMQNEFKGGKETVEVAGAIYKMVTHTQEQVGSTTREIKIYKMKGRRSYKSTP